jgi:hypothetical protein
MVHDYCYPECITIAQCFVLSAHRIIVSSSSPSIFGKQSRPTGGTNVLVFWIRRGSGRNGTATLDRVVKYCINACSSTGPTQVCLSAHVSAMALYNHRRSPSTISVDYDSDASTSSRRSLHAKRQYAIYAEPHRRSLSRSHRSGSVSFRNNLYVDEEVEEEENDHGHPYPQGAATGVSATSVMHRITRLFRNHRRAIIFLGLFFLASSSLHFLNQPYVDVTQARHILDDALKWGGEKVGIKTSTGNSGQDADCHFRSTVEGKHSPHLSLPLPKPRL